MNLYVFASIGAFAVSLILLLLVLATGKQNPKKTAFMPITLLAGTWCLFPTASVLTSDPNRTLLSVKIVYIAALFTGPAFLNFGLTMAEVSTQKFWKRLIRLSYILAILFLPILFSPFMIKGVKKYLPYFVIKPGPIFPFFVLFFTVTCSYAFYRLYRVFLISTGYRRNQIKYVFIGFFLAFLSGIMHFGSAYGLREIFPHDFLVIACTLVLFYAIAQYRLMDISVAVTKAVTLFMVYAIILGIPFIICHRMHSGKFWYVSIILAIMLASGGPFLYSVISTRVLRRVIRTRLKYQQTLLQASKGMTLIKELDKLLNVIIRVMSKAIGVSHAYIYLRNPEADEYNLRAKRNRQNISNLPAGKIQSNIPLIKWLKGHRDILIYDEAALMPEGKNIAKNMKDMQADIIIPSFIQNELIGFLVMGKKLSGDMYTSDDLAVFQVLANQAALAIENAIFYEETGKSLAQQFHEHRLRSIGQMGSMMGHQINNRFQAILAKAEEALDIMQDGMKKVSLSNENKTFLVRAEKAMKSVAENANLGGNITKHLTVFSRKETKYKLVDLDEVITATIELLSYKFDITELNLKTDVEKTPLKIKGDMAQLQDIFFNLLDNAHDAEQQKKQNQKDYIPETKIKAFTDNNLWRIELSDNGIGMTKEESDQLFLPFFTTKATTEKGTGIGSSVIKAMIENHKGTIDVESEYGKGTYFKITLPAI